MFCDTHVSPDMSYLLQGISTAAVGSFLDFLNGFQGVLMDLWRLWMGILPASRTKLKREITFPRKII